MVAACGVLASPKKRSLRASGTRHDTRRLNWWQRRGWLGCHPNVALCTTESGEMMEARNAAGLTQREMGARLKQSHTILAKVESGERRLDVVEFITWLEFWALIEFLTHMARRECRVYAKPLRIAGSTRGGAQHCYRFLHLVTRRWRRPHRIGCAFRARYRRGPRKPSKLVSNARIAALRFDN
jgi:transcriptional regulator with XRE-family HTH domain